MGPIPKKVTQLLSYSITQFLSRPLHLELGYKLKVYFLYYIFLYIYKYIISLLSRLEIFGAEKARI